MTTTKTLYEILRGKGISCAFVQQEVSDPSRNNYGEATIFFSWFENDSTPDPYHDYCREVYHQAGMYEP